MDTITWSDRPPTSIADHRPARSALEVGLMVEELKQNPYQFAVYSTHKTRRAARQRVQTLRRSKTFENQPLRWRTQREFPGDTTSRVRVLVAWWPTATAPEEVES